MSKRKCLCGSTPTTLEELKSALPLLETEEELDAYVEQAAYNENITQAEYCLFYNLALTRYHEIVGE